MSLRPDVALVIHSLAGGGAERVALLLSGELARRGHRVHLVVGRADGEWRESVPDDVELIDLGARRLRFALPRLVRYLRAAKPGALLSFGTQVNALVIVAALFVGHRGRVVVSERIHLSSMIEAGEFSWLRRLGRWIAVLYGRADVVTAVSHAVADDLGKSFGVRDVTVIPNPMIPSSGGGEPSRGRRPGEEEPVVLGVGRLHPDKDFETLLEAVSLLNRDGHPTKTVILGEGPLREALERSAVRLGIADRVELPGFADPAPFLRMASVFVLPSRFEGFPSVLIEALAAGVPVVATDAPGGSREILADGRFGRMVPVGDPESMAEAIAATLDDAPDARVLRGRASDFELASIVHRYEAVLGLRAGAPRPQT